jgi:hypothetical protein
MYKFIGNLLASFLIRTTAHCIEDAEVTDVSNGNAVHTEKIPPFFTVCSPPRSVLI